MSNIQTIKLLWGRKSLSFASMYLVNLFVEELEGWSNFFFHSEIERKSQPIIWVSIDFPIIYEHISNQSEELFHLMSLFFLITSSAVCNFFTLSKLNISEIYFLDLLKVYPWVKDVSSLLNSMWRNIRFLKISLFFQDNNKKLIQIIIQKLSLRHY